MTKPNDGRDFASRPVLLLLIGFTIATGLVLRAGLSGPVAKYGGVALWSTMVYWCVVLVRPTLAPARVLVLTIATSFAVEVAQLTAGLKWLSSQHVVLRLALGTTFNPPDFPAYVAGALLGFAMHRRLLYGSSNR